MSTDTQVGGLCAWYYAFTELIWMIQAKDLLVVSSCGASSQLNNLHSATEATFSATFKPDPTKGDSQIELIITGIGAATVFGQGLYPDVTLQGKIRIEPNIAKQRIAYLIARVGNDIIFLFRSGSAAKIVGGATFSYPKKFSNEMIDWSGNFNWTPPKLDGSTLNATPE